MNPFDKTVSRRDFLKKSSLATLATAVPLILPSRLFGEQAPSKQITLGFIGMGQQGVRLNLRNFLNCENARVLAVCDCKLSRAYDAKVKVDEFYQNTDCDTYQDFREVIARKDIDAIVISTPDHWHVPMSLMGLQGGKHVFSEKPTLTLTEGRELVEETIKQEKVFQWGIEDRSFTKYWMLAGIARTGAIGDIHTVDIGQPYKPLFDKEQPTTIPDDLDWNLWLGPAPRAEYTPSVTENQRWRQHVNYSGGSLTDWGSHLCDTAQIGINMENSGPTEILGTCNQQSENSYVTAPSGYDVLYRYSNNATVRVRDTAKKICIRFEGTKGWVQVENWNGQLSASDMNLFRNKELGNATNYWPMPKREQKNFIDVIRNGGQTTYHAEAGHRLASMLHLGHMAIRSGKTIKWDPLHEMFTKDKAEHESSMVYSRKSRPWEKGL